MGFHLDLSHDTFGVEPGVAVSVAFEVKNEGQAPIKVEVLVEGIDPEWVAIPVAVVEVAGGETVSERIFLKPPREPESLSGVYPFVVRAQSGTGEEKAVACSLEVKPFHNVSIDVQPRRGYVSPFSRETQFQTTVMNLGNVEHTVRLFASDHDELFSYEFDQEQVTVAPGAQKSVAVTATASRSPLLANARLQQLTVSARSLDEKTVATATHAQIEQRALITPGIMLAAALLMFIVAAFIVYLPKRPTVDSFTVTPERITVGDAFTIEWTTSNARAVELIVDGAVYTDLGPSGKKTIESGEMEGVDIEGKQIEIEVRATSGRRVSSTKSRLVSILPKEVPLEPVILEFSITPTEMKVGDVYQVSYKLSESVTEAILEPIGQILDPRLEGSQFNAQVAGEFDYKLTARNAAGDEVERVVHVKIVQGSKASIIVFRADRAFVDPLEGRVTLTWQVNNAARIELFENGRGSPAFTEAEGQIDRLVTQDTTFKLVVYDDEGVTAEKEVTVKTRIIDTP